MKKNQAFKRRVERCEIPKEDLLRILKNESFAPEAATRIIGSGHTPEALIVMVTFDE